MAEIRLVDIKKSFGNVEVLHNINLVLPDKRLTVFVGPSGCGKSTLLRLITGLEEPTSGQIKINGKCVNSIPPAKRGLAMVFQSYALYPHMTVYDNIAFGLRLSQFDKKTIRNKVHNVSKILHIDKLLDRKPKQLSGGQRQRVAIGRALVREPEIYLFDEPLSNIDATLRVQMRTELARFKVELQKTMVYVTHDQVEAMTLADQIVVLNHGWVEQVGDPLTLYNNPVNKFVASFIGSPQMNFIPAAYDHSDEKSHTLNLGQDTHKLTLDCKKLPMESIKSLVEIGIRPEHIRIVPMTEGDLQGEVNVVEHLGSESYVDVNIHNGLSVLVRAPGTQEFKIKEKIGLLIDTRHLHFFDKDENAIDFSKKEKNSNATTLK